MKKLLIFLGAFVSMTNAYSQDATHTVRVAVENNSYMCPNLGMKINRTVIQRAGQMNDWQVSEDKSSATFSTKNSSICNKDSIVKIFVKESEFPFHIITSIKIDTTEVYSKKQ